MQLDTLRIDGFKSFRSPVTIELGEAGLFFMTGRNLVQPRLGPNGCGKSNTWDALTWLFYDRTPRGLRSGDVRSWGSKSGVRVEAQGRLRSGEAFRIWRTWGPISWKLEIDGRSPIDLEKKDNNVVMAELGLSLDMWLTAVVTAQSCPMFLELKPEAKASMFSALLGLDRWSEWGQKADQRAAAIDARMRTLEATTARLAGILEGGQGGLDLASQSAAWEAQREKRLSVLASEYKSLEEYWATAKDDARALAEEEAELRDSLAVLVAETDVAEAKCQKVKAEAEEVRASLKVEEREVDRLTETLHNLKSGAQCPTCLQDVNHKAHDAIRDALTVAKRRETALAADLLEVEERYASRLALLEAAQEAEKKVRRLVDERGLKARQALNDAERTAKDLDAVEDEAEALQAQSNPYAEAQAKQDASTRKTESDLAAARRQLAGLQEDYELSRYWVRGFKDLRYYQMEEALAALEAEVETALADVGLVGWQLLFSIDKMNKSGKASGRGFSVQVVSPESPSTPVPWEAWSGGEAQRLKLAAQIGLGELCRNSTGCDLPLEVWDEPTAGLNAQGVQDLLDCLGNRARRLGRQIWIVDHHSLGYGGFDGTATVVKDRAGSHYEFG